MVAGAAGHGRIAPAQLEIHGPVGAQAQLFGRAVDLLAIHEQLPGVGAAVIGSDLEAVEALLAGLQLAAPTGGKRPIPTGGQPRGVVEIAAAGEQIAPVEIDAGIDPAQETLLEVGAEVVIADQAVLADGADRTGAAAIGGEVIFDRQIPGWIHHTIGIEIDDQIVVAAPAGAVAAHEADAALLHPIEAEQLGELQGEIVFGAAEPALIANHRAAGGHAQPADAVVSRGAAVEQLIGHEAQALVLLPLHLATPAARIGPEAEFLPTDHLAIELDRLQRAGIAAEAAERFLEGEQRRAQAVAVVAGAADEQVAAAAPLQPIGAFAAVDLVVAGAAVENVVAAVTEQHIVAAAALDGVVLVVADQHIVVTRAFDGLDL